jgi:hypothetical protein
VEAEVEQALGQVERADPELLLHGRAREHELVHAQAVVGDGEVLRDAGLLEPREQVVRVEDRRLGGLAQAVAAEGEDVGVGAHEDAVVALEPAQAADRLGTVEVEVVRRLAPDHLGPREVGLDAIRHRDRARARPAAPVGLGEGLVQVVVDDVEAHVARARDAHDRVEVRPVVVEGRPDAVHDRGDLLDVAVEEPERARVREHEAGDLVVGLRPEVVDVDAAVGVRADLHDLVARHGHRGRVRPVGGVRREDLRPRVPAVLVVGAGEQHAGQLAVRAGGGLQVDVGQPGDLAQRDLELVHELEGALRALRVLQRVQAGVPRQRRDALVQLRVVLHRARAEGVEALVEVEVARREPLVVAVDLGLGDLGQLRRVRPPHPGRDEVVERLGLHVELRRDERAAARLRLVEDRAGAVALHRGLVERRLRTVVALAVRDAGVAVQAVVVHGAHAATSVRSAATAAPRTDTSRSMSARDRCSVSAIRSPLGCSG